MVLVSVFHFLTISSSQNLKFAPRQSLIKAGGLIFKNPIIMRANKYYKERQFENTLAEVRASKIMYQEKKYYIEPNMNAELCTDLDNEFYADAWEKFKCYNMDGSVLRDFLKNKGLKICKKNEATGLLFIGKYSDNGIYIKGQVKHYWLCSIKQSVHSY